MKDYCGIELFSAGEIRRTFLLALVRDAAETRQPPLDIIERFIEHPLLKGGLDREFFRKFLDYTNANPEGMRSEVVLAYAELGYQLARRECYDLAPDFLGAVVTWALRSRLLDRAAPYAREGVQDFPDARPELLAAWQRCLGQHAYDRRSFREASVHFEQALVHSRVTRDVRQELDDLTSLTACHTLLRNELEAIRHAAAAEQIAREIDDLDALTKALGDQGNSEFRLQRFKRALKHFEAALEAAQRSGNKQRQSDWSGMLGNVWAALEDLNKAEDFYRRALVLSLETGDLESEAIDHYNLAGLLWFRECYDESIEHETAALRIAEKLGDRERASESRRRLQEHYKALGLHEKAFALQQLERTEERKPGSAGNENHDARAEERPPGIASEGQDQAAGRPVEQDGEMLWERDFTAAIRDREFDRAEQMVNDYISEYPERAAGYFHRGIFLNETRRYEESIAAYNEALARDPKLVPAHYNRLNSYIGMGDLETPRRLYDQHRADSPLDPIPRMMLGRIATISGDVHGGVRELREAHRLAPDNFAVHSALCEGLLQLAISMLSNDFDGAWSVYEMCAEELDRLINDNPTMRVSAYITAAECNEKMAMESHFQQPPLISGFGDIELHALACALKYFRDAGELAPYMQRPSAGFDRVMQIIMELPKARELTRVARVLREKRLRTEALIFLTVSLSKDKRLAGTHYELGLLGLDGSEDNAEQIAEARKHIERALQLDPDNQEYAAIYRQLRLQ